MMARNFPKDQIHTDIVGRAIQNAGPNRVLGVRPPPVDASEVSLPRVSRTTLSQLCSGHCARLKEYQKRIGKTNDETCPDCQLFPQTVRRIQQRWIPDIRERLRTHPSSLLPLSLLFQFLVNLNLVSEFSHSCRFVPLPLHLLSSLLLVGN